MTREEHETLLEEIARSGGDTEKMAEAFDKLRAEYDEREGMLKYYRETYDGENKDKWVAREDYDKVVGERDKARKDYYDRFFGDNASTVMRAQEADIKEDSAPGTFEELFRKREG